MSAVPPRAESLVSQEEAHLVPPCLVRRVSELGGPQDLSIKTIGNCIIRWTPYLQPNPEHIPADRMKLIMDMYYLLCDIRGYLNGELVWDGRHFASCSCEQVG